jgi:hypothetical protein
VKRKKIIWSRNLAYVVGLITTDGCLSKDGRHIAFVSKDLEQIINFCKILKLTNKISPHKSSYNPKGSYYHIQFGNVSLYNFLLKTGLTPNKSFSLKTLDIPPKFFIDFLRGHLDGDGNISVVYHKESQYPQLRLRFCSASLNHLLWMKKSLLNQYNISGGFISKKIRNTHYLVYSKVDATKLLELMYYHRVKYFLGRKYTYYKKKMGE